MSTIKSKEEILALRIIKFPVGENMRDADIKHNVYAAMDTYATQQTQQLREELEKYKGIAESFVKVSDELVRLREENERLKSGDGWVSVEDGLPGIGVRVLCFYTLPHKDGFYEYYKIGEVSSITKYATSQMVEWKDDEYSCFTPSHWQPLPTPPNKQQ